MARPCGNPTVNRLGGRRSEVTKEGFREETGRVASTYKEGWRHGSHSREIIDPWVSCEKNGEDKEGRFQKKRNQEGRVSCFSVGGAGA